MNHKQVFIACAMIVAGVATPIVALAQSGPSLADVALLDAASPQDEHKGLDEGPSLEAIATNDGGKVSLAWNFVGSQSFPSPTDGPQDGQLVDFTSFSVRLERTVKGSTDDVGLFGLDGFDRGTSASLKWTNYRTRVNFGGDGADFRQRSKETAIANCKLTHRSLAAEALAKKCDPDDPGNGGLSYFIQEHASASLDRNLDYVFPSEAIFFWGLEATASEGGYDFLDRQNFEIKDNSEFGFAGEVFLGLIFDNLASVEGSFTYARSHTAAPDIELCRPVVDSDRFECIAGPDGPPKRGDKAIFAGRGTYAFTNGNGDPVVGLALEGAYDVENDSYGLDIPVYFVPDKDGILSGGVRFGYTDKKDPDGGREKDARLGLFFGLRFGGMR